MANNWPDGGEQPLTAGEKLAMGAVGVLLIGGMVAGLLILALSLIGPWPSLPWSSAAASWAWPPRSSGFGLGRRNRSSRSRGSSVEDSKCPHLMWAGWSSKCNSSLISAAEADHQATSGSEPALPPCDIWQPAPRRSGSQSRPQWLGVWSRPFASMRPLA